MHHPLPLSYATRREVVKRVVPLYQEASLAQKVHLLDQIIAVTGYARTYAISLLNHTPPGQRTIQRRRPSRYLAHVQQALVELWKAAKHICAKRLIPFHLARLFRQTVSVPPHAYQPQLRLAYAKTLLAQGFEVGYVTHKTGFAD